MGELNRKVIEHKNVAITTSLATTKEVFKDDIPCGGVIVVSGALASITFYGANDKGGPYGAAHAVDGPIGAVVAGTAKYVETPPCLQGAKYIKMVGDAVGVADVRFVS